MKEATERKGTKARRHGGTKGVVPTASVPHLLLCCFAALLLCPPAPAQVALSSPSDAPPDPARPFYQWSLMAVPPPEARTYRVHDLITIIINETSRQSSDQKLDTEKRADINATLGQILDPWELAQLRLRTGDSRNLRLIDADARSRYRADGEYERNDRFIDRITATVIDVKPNGVLVLEAKRVVETDDEHKTLVISGNVRTEDVTEQNTVQSNQLASLVLTVRHEGEVKRAASKGFLTRVLETLFPF